MKIHSRPQRGIIVANKSSELFPAIFVTCATHALKNILVPCPVRCEKEREKKRNRKDMGSRGLPDSLAANFRGMPGIYLLVQQWYKPLPT